MFARKTRTKPSATIPFSRSGKQETAATQIVVYAISIRFRTPRKSAMPPTIGEVIATSAMLAATTRPHQRSPRPSALPTITVAKKTGKTTAEMTAEYPELAKSKRHQLSSCRRSVISAVRAP